MIVQLDKGVFAIVSWRHQRPSDPATSIVLPDAITGRAIYSRGKTSCCIRLYGPDDDPKKVSPFKISTGCTFCSYQDTFCKETGRKISMTRALNRLFRSKEARRLFWEEYFGRKEHPDAEATIRN